MEDKSLKSESKVFAPSRFEYEARHVYYLPKRVAASLEEQLPIYIVGSRGTGKTTMLKSLNWEERLYNMTLRSQIANAPFEKCYVAVYFKAPQYQLQPLDKWLSDYDVELHGTIFAFYIDLICVELCANALSKLSAEGYLSFTPDDEKRAIQEVFRRFPDALGRFAPRPLEPTLHTLSLAAKDAGREWQALAQLKSPLNDLIRLLPGGQAGEFGRSIGLLLGMLCDGNFADGASSEIERRWHFKLCIDEAEYLSETQQLTLNSLVRIAQWPWFPIAAYSSASQNLKDTLVRNLTLQNADRSLIELDRMEDYEFKELAEGVATVRINHTLKKQNCHFSIKQILGTDDLNAQLEARLRESANRDALSLLQNASQLHKSALSSELCALGDFADGTRDTLPIYQAYLSAELGPDWLKSAPELKSELNSNEEAVVRKKMVAAYLSICKHFNWDVQYGGAEAIIQMSDGCTRDFLLQLNSIFQASEKSLANFLKARIPLALQYKALKQASQNKCDVINQQISQPDQALRLVDGLARITAIIQTTSGSGEHLRSTERGVFKLEYKNATGTQSEKLLSLVKEASVAGYLKVVASEPLVIQFRVHTSLAARYNFSYRGAYYAQTVEWTDLLKLTADAAQNDASRTISSIALRMATKEFHDERQSHFNFTL